MCDLRFSIKCNLVPQKKMKKIKKFKRWKELRRTRKTLRHRDRQR